MANTIYSHLEDAILILKKVSTSPSLDAEIIMEKVLKQPRVFIKSHGEYELSDEEQKLYKELVHIRSTGYPIAYITNTKSFWDMELYVNDSVLVPRPDTETLVEQALQILPEKSEYSMLELGVGSGAISLAIGKERKYTKILGVDVSSEALEIAELNRKKCNISNVKFIYSDWWSSIDSNDKFDLIVSNPPYLSATDPFLSTDSLLAEPKLALVSGETGLECYHAILAKAESHLKPGGSVLLEHGNEQAESVSTLCKRYDLSCVNNVKDLGGNFRLVVASRQ